VGIRRTQGFRIETKPAVKVKAIEVLHGLRATASSIRVTLDAGTKNRPAHQCQRYNPW